MEKVLDLAMKRGAKAEVYLVEREEMPIEFRSDRLHSVARKYTKGVGLRVIKDGRVGFSATTDLSRLGDLVENALQSAKYGQEAKFEFPVGRKYPQVRALNQAVKDFAPEAGVEEGREAISMIKEGNPEIICDLEIHRTVERVTLVNSDGLSSSFERSGFSYFIIGLVIIDRSLCWIWEGKSSSDLCLETEEFVSSILKKAELAKTTVSVAQKRLPVIFAPHAMLALLQALFLGVNGKQIQKGSSPLVGRVGERVLDEKFSLWDDGTREFGIRSGPFDGEGVPSQRTPLFENGVLEGYLLDLQTAGLLGGASTGNGVRDYSTQPVPNVTNPVVAPGDWPLKDMISDMGEGVVVYDVLGGGHSNLLAGDFSLNLSLAYKVEGGEMVGRVKDCMIAGNVYEEFKEILGIGDKAEEASGVYTPAFYFPAVMVTS